MGADVEGGRSGKVELLVSRVKGGRKLFDVCRECELRQSEGRVLDGDVHEGRRARLEGEARRRERRR